MTDNMNVFGNNRMDKNKMLAALYALNAKLAESDESGELILFGGAVMCLVYGSRGYTRDIDALFEPKTKIYAESLKIADDLNLPLDWLNDGVKGWIYSEPPKEVYLDLSNLRIWVAAPEYILAMKCHAARIDTDDLADAQVLAKHLNLTTADEVLELTEKYIPKKFLMLKHALFAEAIFSD